MQKDNISFDINALLVKPSYLMGREIAHALAAIKQKHFQEQQSDPSYWDRDKAAQHEDGVEPDKKTGLVIPKVRYQSPSIDYSNGEPNASESNRTTQAQSDADVENQTLEAAEVQKNTVGIMDMMRAAPKVLSALLQPNDSPMALARLKVCQGCEHWTGSKCKKCGCFTNLKVRLPGEACPIGKWGKEE